MFHAILDQIRYNSRLPDFAADQECPLPGHTDQYGRVESVIYRAKITREDTGATEHYTGLTGGTFMTRWYGHMTNIRNYDPKDGSYGKRMSRYVGDLNYRMIPNTITWSIVCRAPTYNPVTKSCRLCLMEKFLIMFESSSATLNVKSELFDSPRPYQFLLMSADDNICMKHYV